jgi:hypothetical protein
VAAGAAPATSGFIAYDSTSNTLEAGINSANQTILTTATAVTAAQGGTGASNTATTGRYLRGNGTNFVTSEVAAAGAGSCTNQFVRANNDNGAPTCASVSLTADVTGTLPAGSGGTGNAYTAFTGPTTAVKTFTLPNADATILTTNAAVTVGQGGTGATTLTGLLQGNGTSTVTAVTNSSTVGQVLRVTGSSAYGWGAVDLADSDAITGTLPDANIAAKHKTREFGFIIGADNGSALGDGDDQATVFRNSLGNGITITEVWCESDAGTPSINLQRDDGSPANILSSNLSCTTSGATGTIDGNEDNLAAGERVDFVMATAGGTAKRVSVFVKYTVD